MSVLSCSRGRRDRCESFCRGMGRSIVASGDDGAPVSPVAPYHLNRSAVIGARLVGLGPLDRTRPDVPATRGQLNRKGCSCSYLDRLTEPPPRLAKRQKLSSLRSPPTGIVRQS